jgi:hypothetical protein
MLVAFVFEWQFSPARFFQDLSEISVRGYLAQIERETIRVLISRTQIGNTAPNDVQTELSRELETIFLSQQLITGLPFSLNENGIYEQYEDGHRVGLISATINIACASAFMSDFIHKNKYGEVIQDTKKQRDAYKALVRNVVKDKFDRDSCLRAILRSYHQSLQDPRNSLIYLYEVIENLEVRLGGSNNSDARKTMVSELSQFRLFELGGECI